MAEKKHLIDNAELMAEWNWERNTDLDPHTLTAGSNKKAWWKCANGHEWQAIIQNRSKRSGCPYCAGQKVLKGHNDLKTVNPLLAKEWNYDKNSGLCPEDFMPNSNKSVWWICNKGHEWQATIVSRNGGNRCPYCSGHKVLKGYNDLQTVNPILSKEWNYGKNGALRPVHFTANSGQKIWWKCNKGHEWQATIDGRNRGSGCPYCTGHKVLMGYNDLQTLNPTLAREWNYEKNPGLTPTKVMLKSGKKVWWKCDEGHEWQATVASRSDGRGCPYCSGRYVIKGENDLQTINPTLAKEWNHEKNNGLTPMDVLPNSEKKVWWKCNKGHEWNATVGSRNSGNGCPICNSEQSTSFPEYALIFYLEKYGLKTIHSYRKMGYELDVFIPSKKVAIEYDGYYWHKNKSKQDLSKNLKCKKDGIKLYRIRENLPSLNDSSIDYIITKSQKDLSKTFAMVLSEIIGFDVDVDLNRDNIDIEILREHIDKENSLMFSNPEVANEWNYEKNGNLKPEHFATNSSKRVWWKCSKGHEWQAIISSRNDGHGCPYCTGNKVLRGYNDLQTINPNLAKEWHHEKNRDLKPEHFTVNSGKKVWWKCNKGHEWQATVAHRSHGHGCPYCSGRYAISGENDLQTTNPTLTQEWNHEKNNDIMPTNVLPNSNKRVWWKCNSGHEWQARVVDRSRGSGCPICRKSKKKQ